MKKWLHVHNKNPYSLELFFEANSIFQQHILLHDWKHYTFIIPD